MDHRQAPANAGRRSAQSKCAKEFWTLPIHANNGGAGLRLANARSDRK